MATFLLWDGSEIAFSELEPDAARPQPPAREEFWRTRDGRLIAVGDMDENHVRNALRMVIRRCRSQAEEDEDLALCTPIETSSDVPGDFNPYANLPDRDRTALKPNPFQLLPFSAGGPSWRRRHGR